MLKSVSLTAITPATDCGLLTTRQLRAAVGLKNSARDIELKSLGASVSAAIVRECSIARAGALPPTLRLETLTEVFRPRTDPAGGRLTFDPSHPGAMCLSRRPVVSISSIVLEGTTLDPAADFEFDAASGMVYRLCNDRRVEWRCQKTTVVYQAGWAVVPDDLILAASRLASIYWNASEQDSNVKMEMVQDVGRTEYFGNQLATGALPLDVADLIQGYVQHWFA